MRILEMYLGGLFLLIAMFLVIRDPGASGQVIRSLSDLNTDAVKALQGRG